MALAVIHSDGPAVKKSGGFERCRAWEHYIIRKLNIIQHRTHSIRRKLVISFFHFKRIHRVDGYIFENGGLCCCSCSVFFSKEIFSIQNSYSYIFTELKPSCRSSGWNGWSGTNQSRQGSFCGRRGWSGGSFRSIGLTGRNCDRSGWNWSSGYEKLAEVAVLLPSPGHFLASFFG